jgi:hypothetical protein
MEAVLGRNGLVREANSLCAEGGDRLLVQIPSRIHSISPSCPPPPTACLFKIPSRLQSSSPTALLLTSFRSWNGARQAQWSSEAALTEVLTRAEKSIRPAEERIVPEAGDRKNKTSEPVQCQRAVLCDLVGG